MLFGQPPAPGTAGNSTTNAFGSATPPAVRTVPATDPAWFVNVIVASLMSSPVTSIGTSDASRPAALMFFVSHPGGVPATRLYLPGMAPAMLNDPSVLTADCVIPAPPARPARPPLLPRLDSVMRTPRNVSAL